MLYWGVRGGWRAGVQRACFVQTIAAATQPPSPPPTHLTPRPCPRFGAQGVRVVQLLLSRGHLEQKQVADLTMGPQKETRELLYRLGVGVFRVAGEEGGGVYVLPRGCGSGGAWGASCWAGGGV